MSVSPDELIKIENIPQTLSPQEEVFQALSEARGYPLATKGLLYLRSFGIKKYSEAEALEILLLKCVLDVLTSISNYSTQLYFGNNPLPNFEDRYTELFREIFNRAYGFIFSINCSDQNKRGSTGASLINGGGIAEIDLTFYENGDVLTIGEANHGNVGVYENTSIVSMMDCDSFHLANGQHRCGVCMPGYAAPELLKHMRNANTMRYDEAPLNTFTRNTDLFSLATHIFRLLMNGVSPYNGIDTTVRTSSDVVGAGDEPVEKGMYVFRQGFVPYHPACPPKHVLTDRLLELFNRAFLYGEQSSRPSALEWHSALMEYQSLLKYCRAKSSHQYYKKLSCCPWCEAENRDRVFKNTKDQNKLPKYKVKRK